MDPKGGSWVGEMYQKFEAMCAEVEEVMSEDTLKYVENQVRTVGKTVKKFYSDVIQDFHQPSSLDTVKSGDPLMTFIHQGDGDGVICRNPKRDDKTKSVDAIPEKMVNNVNGAAACDDSMYNGYCDSAICSVIKPCEPTSNKSPIDNKCTKVSSLICGTKSALSNQSTHVVKILDCRKDFQNKCLSSSPSINPTVTNNTDEEITFIAPHDESDKPSSVHKDDCSDKASEVSDNENDVGVSREMIEGYEGRDVINEKETRVHSGKHFSADLDISPKKADAADLSAIITSTKERSVKYDEEVSISHRETLCSFNTCEFKGYDADKQNVRIGEYLNLVRLEDSCVLVEMNDDSAKYAPDHIQKSYKKKIQDVFSPRRWSKGKRDQEQFAVWYEDQSGRNFSSTKRAEIQKSQVSESFESDWELL
ncbi:uncharacterized protein LOC110685967 isoform X1 [Chenopodium quinoa]|uniref:uncharacterized protein LOC110685967 isoform X1 n=1 Tax=Chenopodium quinoa TaxID=63459 RepID=UPI000B78A0B2|nr:uncharacterized protein LOC110685967 isoform X1 [Chenopodium quinoa]XP_021718223.1 uncharacterized protein LOC110685967 isoform X1 [Chenopodium quinoa]